IELLENFAAQAVIAIENTRLLNELRESLQQQTATADVLKVISRSTFDLQYVFDTLVKSAARLCLADKANLALFNEYSFQYQAAYGFDPDYNEYMRSIRVRADRGSINGRTVLQGNIVHVHDVLADPEFNLHDAQKLGSFRTALGVPLLREGTPVGVIFLTRGAVDPFTQQQIDLVQTFAAQAVIAIENTRLLNELRESLHSVLWRTVQDGKMVHVADVQSDPDFADSDLARQRTIGGARTVLGVPLLREGIPIGVIILSRFLVRPFTDKQIELVTTFADQAVIAIENVRLFDEVQARTRELTEALEQQTATSEVLHVISSSPGELEPVFRTMLENAVRVCDAKFGSLFRYDGEFLHFAA